MVSTPRSSQIPADRPAWPEARDAEQLDEAREDLGDELVVVGHPPGRGDLGDLVADRGADARDLGRVAGTVGGDEVDGAAADGVRGAVIGDGLEAQLALDLRHVADLMEDPGEVAVRQVSLGGLVFVAEVGIGGFEIRIVRLRGRSLGVKLGDQVDRGGQGRIGAGDAGHGRDGSRDGVR